MDWVVLIFGILAGSFIVLVGIFVCSPLGERGTPEFGIPIIVVGGLVFLGALIFHREIARSTRRTGKYLWGSIRKVRKYP